MILIEYLFWLSAGLVVYGTVGYPALIWVLAKLAPKPVRKGDILPTVTCVIAARNEEHTIGAKLENLLASDYPPDRLDIIIVSDGSTDNTAAIVEQWINNYNSTIPQTSLYSDRHSACLRAETHRQGLDPESSLSTLGFLYSSPLEGEDSGGGEAGITEEWLHAAQTRVRLLTVPTHHGKAHALNMGVAAAHSEIILFADARQRFAPDAVRALVANFADPDIGAACGELILEAAEPGTVGEGLGFYWQYEKFLRKAESASGSTVVCTGAIYAIRKACFRPLPEGTLVDDLLTPMRIILAGHRVVFEPRAIAFDRLSSSSSQEFARKVRTLAGNIQVLRFEPGLLNPFNRFRVWRYWSHMLLPRVLMPYCLIALLLSNIGLSGIAYRSILAVQVLIYLAAFVGLRLGSRAWLPIRAASTFFLLNAASLRGAVSYVFRPSDTLWRGNPSHKLSPRSSLIAREQ